MLSPFRRISLLTPAAILFLAACAAQVGRSAEPTIAEPPLSVAPAPPASATPDLRPRICQDFFLPPPVALDPVPGISVRVIDKVTFEIINANLRTYYLAVRYWETQDDLVCGRGVVDHRDDLGRVRPGTWTEPGGSSQDIPARVQIWAQPCGEGCDRTPLGEYDLPISTVDPPEPGST